jgi:hypothetical protein
MERSYARSSRYGFDRARWRGLWKVAIQEYLICTIQNIEALIRHIGRPVKAILCLAPIHVEGPEAANELWRFLAERMSGPIVLHNLIGSESIA